MDDDDDDARVAVALFCLSDHLRDEEAVAVAVGCPQMSSRSSSSRVSSLNRCYASAFWKSSTVRKVGHLDNLLGIWYLWHVYCVYFCTVHLGLLLTMLPGGIM